MKRVKVLSLLLTAALTVTSLSVAPSNEADAAKKLVKLGKKKITVTVGQKKKIRIVPLKKKGSSKKGKSSSASNKKKKIRAKVKWKSSNKKIVKVVKKKVFVKKANCRVLGIAPGKAVVKAVYKRKKVKATLKCKVTVVPAEGTTASTAPTTGSSAQPTSGTSAQPTDQGTVTPTETPTAGQPSDNPTQTPSDNPTQTPSDNPTQKPTATPPTGPTNEPYEKDLDISSVVPINPADADNCLSYDAETGTLTAKDLEGILVPIGEDVVPGETVEITIYGSAKNASGDAQIRAWLSDAQNPFDSNYSEIQNPAEWGKTYSYTALEKASGIQIKKIAYDAENFTELVITRIVVKKSWKDPNPNQTQPPVTTEEPGTTDEPTQAPDVTDEPGTTDEPTQAPTIEGIDLSGTTGTGEGSDVVYDSDTNTVKATKVDLLFIPLGKQYSEGDVLKITIYGSSTPEAARAWLTYGENDGTSSNQVNPMEWGKTYEYTATGSVNTLEIKKAEWNSPAFDEINITKVTVEEVGAEPTATPEPFTPVDPTTSQEEITGVVNTPANLNASNVAYKSTVGDPVFNKDGSVDVVLSYEYSGLGICFYLNDEHSDVKMSDYDKIVIDYAVDRDYPMCVELKGGEIKDNYWDSGAVTVPEKGSEYPTFTAPSGSWEKDISSLDENAKAVFIKYNTYNSDIDYNCNLKIKSIRLVKSETKTVDVLTYAVEIQDDAKVSLDTTTGYGNVRIDEEMFKDFLDYYSDMYSAFEKLAGKATPEEAVTKYLADGEEITYTPSEAGKGTFTIVNGDINRSIDVEFTTDGDVIIGKFTDENGNTREIKVSKNSGNVCELTVNGVSGYTLEFGANDAEGDYTITYTAPDGEYIKAEKVGNKYTLKATKGMNDAYGLGLSYTGEAVVQPSPAPTFVPIEPSTSQEEISGVYYLPLNADTVVKDGNSKDITFVNGAAEVAITGQYGGVWFNIPEDKQKEYVRVEVEYEDGKGGFGYACQYVGEDGDKDIIWGGQLDGTGVFKQDFAEGKVVTKFKFFNNGGDLSAENPATVVIKSVKLYEKPVTVDVETFTVDKSQVAEEGQELDLKLKSGTGYGDVSLSETEISNIVDAYSDLYSEFENLANKEAGAKVTKYIGDGDGEVVYEASAKDKGKFTYTLGSITREMNVEFSRGDNVITATVSQPGSVWVVKAVKDSNIAEATKNGLAGYSVTITKTETDYSITYTEPTGDFVKLSKVGSNLSMTATKDMIAKYVLGFEYLPK